MRKLLKLKVNRNHFTSLMVDGNVLFLKEGVFSNAITVFESSSNRELNSDYKIGAMADLCKCQCVLFNIILGSCDIDNINVAEREALVLIIKIIAATINCSDECTLEHGCQLGRKLAELECKGYLGTKFKLFYEEMKKNLLSWLVF